MRVHILAVAAILSTGAAHAQSATACRLSTRECAVIASEMAAEQVFEAQDRRSFGWGLSPYERGRQLIIRQGARLRQRAARLPPRIARELVRINLCDSEAGLAASSGRPYVPMAQCR